MLGKGRQKEIRNHLLRGVLEDNLHIERQGGVRAVLEPLPPQPARKPHWILVLALLAMIPLLSLLDLPFFNATPLASNGSGAIHSDPYSSAAMASKPLPLAPLSDVQLSNFGTPRLLNHLVEREATDSIDYSLLLSDNESSLTSIFGLDVKTIVIDAGHGGVDPGAIGSHGTKEKDITLDIALRLRDRLRKSGNYHIILTRDKDHTMALNERVEFANTNKADLFVSIHVNSIPNKRINFIETYYFGAPTDNDTIRLAKAENQGSNYRMGDFQEIIQKLGNTLKRQESTSLAHSIQTSLFTNIKRYNQKVLNVGVKSAPFVVLLGVDAPGVLTEVSCITNDEEEAKLNTGEYRDKIALFLEQGIHNYLNQNQAQMAGESQYEQGTDG